MVTKKIIADAASVNSTAEMPVATPAINTPTPENTAVPGGGRWRWDIALPGWVEIVEDQPLQPGDVGALQTTEPAQE